MALPASWFSLTLAGVVKELTANNYLLADLYLDKKAKADASAIDDKYKPSLPLRCVVDVSRYERRISTEVDEEEEEERRSGGQKRKGKEKEKEKEDLLDWLEESSAGSSVDLEPATEHG
ncbi:hypothetical protein JCM8097_002741 [Rhodosporidiobolus ruineniae]